MHMLQKGVGYLKHYALIKSPTNLSYEKRFHNYYLHAETFFCILSTDYDDDYYNQNKALDLFKSMDR